ncbi:MAG: hypothetical protein WCH62_01400 [Candidatus Omnitrophota bacterium]
MKTNHLTKLAVVVSVLMWSVPALASMAQIKVYKEAFTDAKPKCVGCHVDAMPKKDGDHELNAYGKAVADAAGKDAKPTVDTYKKVGSIEDFAKSGK